MKTHGKAAARIASMAFAMLIWALATSTQATAAEPGAACIAGPDRAIDLAMMGRAEWTRELQRGNVTRGASAGRRTTVNRNTTINRRTTVNRRTNVNVRRTNVNVVHRPVRVWAPRPYYGRIVGGVALGAVIVAVAASVPPAVPAPGLCWFWSDATQTRGYWDYC